MYNVKAAVSRLDFAPKARAMEVTDIATGHFVFTPHPDKPISYSKLSKAIQGAGYKIEEAFIEVSGRVSTIDGKIALTVEHSGQHFWLVSEEVKPESETIQVVAGAWSEEEGRQTIRPTGSRSRTEGRR